MDDLNRALYAIRRNGNLAVIDLANQLAINSRYARELTGLALNQQLVRIEERAVGDVLILTWEGIQHLETLDKQDLTRSQGHDLLKVKGKGNQTNERRPAMAKETKIEFTKCGCGCGEDIGGKATFRQGHDARMVSQLVAAVVGQDAGARRNKQANPVVPPVFTKDEAEMAVGPHDIQDRITRTVKAVEAHFGSKLAAKADSAMMNGWNREVGRNASGTPRVAKAKVEITAKVGRWTKTGTVDSKGRFHTQDAKGNPQLIEKGKYQPLAS